MRSDLPTICVCPACRSQLTWSDAAVDCTGCGAHYRIVADVPVLLVTESPPGLEERWYTGAPKVVSGRVAGALGPYRRYLWPPRTYKTMRSRNRVARFAASFAEELVVNVGAGETDYGPNVLNLEIEPGPGVDVVGVAERLPLADGCAQAVILMAVLEHVQDAEQTLAEARRVLAPGGRLLVDAPFIQGYHASPADYRRFTEQGLRALLEKQGFEIVESGVAVGPASGMAWVCSEFLALLVSGRSTGAYRLARLATRWLTQPLKYADVWLERHPMAFTIASGTWAVASRPRESPP